MFERLQCRVQMISISTITERVQIYVAVLVLKCRLVHF